MLGHFYRSYFPEVIIFRTLKLSTSSSEVMTNIPVYIRSTRWHLPHSSPSLGRAWRAPCRPLHSCTPALIGWFGIDVHVTEY